MQERKLDFYYFIKVLHVDLVRFKELFPDARWCCHINGTPITDGYYVEKEALIRHNMLYVGECHEFR